MKTNENPGEFSGNSTLIQFADFILDEHTGELRKRGIKLRLQEQPFQILALLVKNPGVLVTREELRQKLWPSDTFVDFDHGLNTAINKLREVLGDSASAPRFIETLPRRGYRFVFAIEPSQGTAAEARTKPATQTSDAVPESGRNPTTDHAEVDTLLPQSSRSVARGWLLLIQLMYLCFYVSALAHVPGVEFALQGVLASGRDAALGVMVLSGLTGIAVRLYVFSATAFDFRGLGVQFSRIFPALFVLDELWALAPLLLWQHLGSGLSLAAVAALVWVPFGQRTLMRMAYPTSLGKSHPE